MTDPASTTTGLQLGFLGDDFSGSTDVLEVLSRLGLRTALFTDLPDARSLAALEGIQAVGIAGNTRSLPVEKMLEPVTDALECLAILRPSLLHYKICSTFDSSPRVGSIGAVIDLGSELLGTEMVPVLAAAPPLGRYCAFGNLFARSGLDSEPFRLDRHPTMSRHPVTPMSESDLRLHLGHQTSVKIGLLDVLSLEAGVEASLERLRRERERGCKAVIIDAIHERHLPVIGRALLAGARPESPAFVVGSSGVEMALGEAWLEDGVSPGRVQFPHPGPARPLLVLSGSCSPVTAAQIERALSRGYREVTVDTPRLLAEPDGDEHERCVSEAVRLLEGGEPTILHVARGPDDPRIPRSRLALFERDTRTPEPVEVACGDRIAEHLGRIGREILERLDLPLRRLAVTGGDTGWKVARQLGIESLEMIAPAAPGSPLCRARGRDTPVDGREIVFKGGQVGTVDFFDNLLTGDPG